MKIKVSDYIVDRLVRYGTDVFFGYQGGNISHLIDSIGNHPDAKFVETCHEQAAAFAANAYAQISGKIGVALASSGPGAINLINGIANAFCDSIPCLFFTGDVNTSAKRTNSSRRQNAFQEIDIIPIVRSISKYAISVNEPEAIIPELEKAINIAADGRPGPVIINLPHDIQRSFIKAETADNADSSKKNDDAGKHAQTVIDAISFAKKPVFLIGGGLRAKQTRDLFNIVLDGLRIPVICSLLGLDVIRHDHPCFRGVIGDYGIDAANTILKRSDCVIVLGSRLDDRQISASLAEELGHKRFVHVDIDPYELGYKIKDEEKIECDLSALLSALYNLLPTNLMFDGWLQETHDIFWENDQFASDLFHPNRFIRDVSKACEAVFCFDVGNNQMHAMQSLYVRGNSKVLTSGGLGSMGYSIPAAIGACFSTVSDKVISICGDGGIQMNLQELQTIAYHKLPINIILLNNSGLGMIYDLQNRLFDGRHTGTTENYGVPDFEKVARAYGFDYIKVKDKSGFAFALETITKKNGVFVDFVHMIGTSISMKL